MEINQKLTVNRKFLALGIPLLVLFFTVALGLSSYAVKYPELYTGITYDLILTIPLLVYFLSKRKISKFIISSFVSIGIITAYFVIPETEKFHFNLIRYILLPTVEVVIIGSIVYYTFKTVNGTNKKTNERTDYLIAFQNSGTKAFNNNFLGKIFGSELAMFHYAFFNWKSKPLSENEFSYHEKSGTISLLIGILMILIIETVGVHFLLTKWSSIAAWVLTLLSVYSFIMLCAHLKAITKRPHMLHSDSLELKLGLLGTTNIPFQKIEKIEFVQTIDDTLKSHACQFTPLGDLESFNTVIHLKDQIDCEFIYGIKRKYKTLLINLDKIGPFEKKYNTLYDLSQKMKA
ncbi:hypothetical protein [Hanstruepera marina]|uniref:hypothetical protein n=1 Tax=Hanstruepera marina TaxID=2873265 RepID=UPI001CA65419|nr:hypothetical protein [Hanstruepera marina]